jgi:hypothetical protein
MRHRKSVSALSEIEQRPVSTSSLPREVLEALDAAEGLYKAVGAHAPAISPSNEVLQEWKRLGECLAWLQRSPR